MDENEEKLFTVKEAAEFMGVSPAAIYEAMDEGRLPYTKLYGRKLVKKSDAVAYHERAHPGGNKPKGRPVGSRTQNKK